MLFSSKKNNDEYQNMLMDSYMQSGRIKQQFEIEFHHQVGNKFLKVLSHLLFWTIIITGIYFIFC